MELNSVNAASNASLEAKFSSLTFIGGTAEVEDTSTHQQDAADGSIQEGANLPLAMTATGDRRWIAAIKGGRRTARRLGDLGLVVGCEITIVSRTDSGSVIVGLQGCRIGLGAGMAHQVIVTTSPLAVASSTTQPSAQPVPGDTTMATSQHLGALAVGQSGRILGYEKGARSYREKLLSMGLIPGTSFTVTRQAPLGDPVEIKVRGFKLSLRKAEAALLQVESLGDEGR